MGGWFTWGAGIDGYESQLGKLFDAA